METILGSYTYDSIVGCIEATSRTLGLSKHSIVSALDHYYPGIEQYINDECVIPQVVKSNPSIVFFYFSGSKDVPPGKGAGEQIPKNEEPKFVKLSQIRNWRKILSNFWIAPFKLDGLTWNSVEHYYQGSKFKKNNPDFFKLFSLESGSEISKDPNMAKGAGGKSGKYKGEVIRSKNVVIDPDFFAKDRCNKDMYRAMMAKFSQNEDVRQVLVLTRDAILTHGTRGVPTKPIYTLMKAREELN